MYSKFNDPIVVAIGINNNDEIDFVYIASTYAKTTNPQTWINGMTVKYITSDQNKISRWEKRTGLQLPFGISTSANTIVQHNDSNIKNSLKDSNGNTLTKEQQEYFS